MPRILPGNFTRLGIHADDERVGVLIRDEDDPAIGVDRRGDQAVLAIEGSERPLPEKVALEVVSDQAVVSKECENLVVFIGDDGRRRGVIELVPGIAAGSAKGSPPLDLAGLAAEAHRDEIVVFGGGEEDAIPDHDG